MSNAPKLEFKHKKQKDGLAYMLPQNKVDKLFALIDGHNGNALKLAIVLLGTKEGFAPSVKWICDRTGMDKSNYYRARKYLEELGIITITNSVIRFNI